MKGVDMKRFLSCFVLSVTLLLFAGCGGQVKEGDNSADVLARIEAGSTPLTPPPTKEVIQETPQTTEPVPSAEPTPASVAEHPAISTQQRTELLKKTVQFLEETSFSGEQFTILQQEDTVVGGRYYLWYKATVQKRNYPANISLREYYMDMETEELYLKAGESLYSHKEVTACINKMKETLSDEEEQRQLCELEGEKEHSGKQYYVMHVFSCSPAMEDGTGMTYTYGWYYIQKSTMEIFRWNAADDSLVKC